MSTPRLYAEGTEVSVTKSQQEIAQLAERYGATGYMCGWQADRAVVEFIVRERRVRFVLNLDVSEDDMLIKKTRGNQWRTPAQRKVAVEKEIKRRWRSFAMCIKAKFDAVETGIFSFEDEFFAHIVLPSGATVGDEIKPGVASVYAGEAASLPALESGR